MEVPGSPRKWIAVYRLYHPDRGDHLYTTSNDERRDALQRKYRDEGILGFVWPTPRSGFVEVKRLDAQSPPDHAYTIDDEEASRLLAGSPYALGPPFGFAPPRDYPGAAPVFALLQPAIDRHFYTTSSEERDVAIPRDGYSADWGIAYHVLLAPPFDEVDLEQTGDRDEADSRPADFVWCLAIDMIGSVEAGLRLPSVQNDRFNRSFVDQIRPHLEAVGLRMAKLKFTGDGWLVTTATIAEVRELCELALRMAAGFKREMSELTGIEPAQVPDLRLAITAGRDITVQLPRGGTDWVGDSIRRATRILRYCEPNEMLVDETVRAVMLRDTEMEPVSAEDRLDRAEPKPSEEALVIHRLKGFRGGA